MRGDARSCDNPSVVMPNAGFPDALARRKEKRAMWHPVFYYAGCQLALA